MDRNVVERVAKVSRLNLTEEELEEFRSDLEDILDYFEMLDSASAEEAFAFNPVDIADVLREDVPHSDIDPKELLRDMNTYDGYVRGPKLT